MKVLLYCTKAKPILRDYRGKAIYDRFVISPTDRPFTSDDTQPMLNGKIVAECDFEVEGINCSSVFNHCYATWNLGQDELLQFSCLERKQLVDYLGYENQIDGKWCGYAIHINNLHIFNEPKELNDYMSGKFEEWDYRDLYEVKKAPQNMQYVSSFYSDEISMWGDTYILISIQPQWLCKILNGEKTIEIRKKVIKEMLE